MGVERYARVTTPGYQAWQAQGEAEDAARWVQIDLGHSQPLDIVKLFPVIDWGGQSTGFPARFRLEASNDPEFHVSTPVVDRSTVDYPDPGDAVGVFRAEHAVGRYVRLTVTRLRARQLTLAKIEVWSGGKEVGVDCPTSDSAKGDLGKIALTRPPRPQGDEVVTDNPGNVIPVSQWKPVPDRIRVPKTGVRLENGVFRTAMENNISYLLSSFTPDEMLRQFRERAGKPSPPGLRNPDGFWDVALPGSSAGRFLMGAGNTLRWMENPELRRRMDSIVDGIAECRQADGFIMAYPENTIFFSERAAYTRSWLTHGLIEAGFAGNSRAFSLLRGNYDWFDHCVYLPELLRRGGQGVQGMIANTRMFFTPVGKPEDLQVVQRYFQENYWLNELAGRDARAIWQYPYDHPHNYLLTSLEPYLDLYRATGAKRYLEASQGGWDLYHDHWEHVGGSIAICEGDAYPPGSYFLHKHTGELCGSVFWVRYNQRFHQLYPDQEKYVGEIEKSIYNVGLANQVGSKGIRYHANMVGRKDAATPINVNSCCEGQGTRLLGSLPEYLYSLAGDGLYLDMFAPSTITWKQGAQSFQVHTDTAFPEKPEVAVHFSVSRPTRSVLRVRVPAWATHAMPILVNGKRVATGKPGSYVPLDRVWTTGDTVAFTLPVGFRMTRYQGMEQVSGQERYALEYGPILLAAVNSGAESQEARLDFAADTLSRRLKPVAGQPLHFAIENDTQHQFMPYWQVADQVFTCYPVIGGQGPPIVETVGADDLALASRGAIATADSEYSKEPGGTAKVIDGVIATTADYSNRWHSSLETPHPHWIQVKLPKPVKVGVVVLHFADPEGHPTSFQGIARGNGKDEILFDVKNYAEWRRFKAVFPPVITDTFRLVIRESANPTYPNAAQVSEIELYPPSRHALPTRSIQIPKKSLSQGWWIKTRMVMAPIRRGMRSAALPGPWKAAHSK